MTFIFKCILVGVGNSAMIFDCGSVIKSVLLFFVICRSDQVYYYMPGFVMLAFLALVVVCAEISVLLCYFHLCSEDYRWWWRSFFSTGTVAFYFFLFSVHYLFHKTSITGGRSYLLYFGYTLIMVFLFFIMTGKG